jgi:hypothetical protein
MEKFQLTAFLEITGIGSASGLVYCGSSLFIISDNAGFLYEYNIDSEVLTPHPLISNSSENILKKDKPDFEAIALKGNKLHVFGSGSTEKRNRKLIFDINTQLASEENLEPLYQKIKTGFNISDDELNIEGALFHNEKLYLFQRGNGCSSKNGIAIIHENGVIQFQPVKLPKIKHVEATFTDAVLVEDKIYFLAAAEDTISTYDDGEVLGSIIGCLDIDTFHIDFTYQISDRHKFEGLALFHKSGSKTEFLLCEDNDTEHFNTTIYKLSLKTG